MEITDEKLLKILENDEKYMLENFDDSSDKIKSKWYENLCNPYIPHQVLRKNRKLLQEQMQLQELFPFVQNV